MDNGHTNVLRFKGDPVRETECNQDVLEVEARNLHQIRKRKKLVSWDGDMEANGVVVAKGNGHKRKSRPATSVLDREEAPTPCGSSTLMPPTPSSDCGRGAIGSAAEGSFASGETTRSTVSTLSPSSSANNNSSKNNCKDFKNWEVGSRYRIVKLLGHGSYGEVAEAWDIRQQKRVAIKKIPNVFDLEVDAKRIYREIYILRHLDHGDIIKLVNIVKPANYEDFKDLYLVFEYVDTDLYKLILSPQYLSIAHIQTFLYQLLCGLKYIHSAHVIHRDMKPANILLNEDCTLKICDFGLARVVEGDIISGRQASKTCGGSSTPTSSPSRKPKFVRQLTKHVVTRWYRSPELILLQEYDCAVDMWSLGCILAELFSMQAESVPHYRSRVPLFPGKSCFPLSADMPTTYSDKLDQLNVIFDVIGTPSDEDIKNLGDVKQYLRKLPYKPPRSLEKMFPGAPPSALDLLRRMLCFNPSKRITVDEALEHEFLRSIRKPEDEIVAKVPISMEVEKVKLSKKLIKSRIYEEILYYAKVNKEDR